MKYLGYVLTFVLGAAITWVLVPNKSSVMDTKEAASKTVVPVTENKAAEKVIISDDKREDVEDATRNDESSVSIQEIEALQQQLAVMENTNQQLTQRLNKIEQPVKSEKDKEAANDDLFADVPESHRKLLEPKNDAPKTIDQLHEEVVEQEEDISWATLKEQQLNHYIHGHRYSNFIDIHMIQCKTNLCEILGTEIPSDYDAWFTISDELKNESWAKFSGNSTSSNNAEHGNKIFVTILRMRPVNNKQKIAP